MKRVLLDENLPRLLKHDLVGHTVRTVVEEGWSGIFNGELLQRAAASFDELVTADQNLEYQQNLASASCGVVLLAARIPGLRICVRCLPTCCLRLIEWRPVSWSASPFRRTVRSAGPSLERESAHRATWPRAQYPRCRSTTFSIRSPAT